MALILAQSFLDAHKHELTAGGTLILGAAGVIFANRWITRRGVRLATVVAGGQLSRSADTRLHFLRRAVDATIVIVASAVALSQFTALDKLGQTVLASGAIAAAIVGFAARQTLANAVAGVFLAVTQPLRIGDLVTFEAETGTVEDIRLTSTWLRTGTGSRIIVGNERLAGGILRNDSIIDPFVAVEASLWLGAEVDAVEAVDRLRAALQDVAVRLAETSPEGTRIVLTGAAAAPGDRIGRESDLREQALRALQA